LGHCAEESSSDGLSGVFDRDRFDRIHGAILFASKFKKH
jgi:hypothetical protein